ncbi:MAG: hypothetical protein GY832_10655 [Chloroflexi bacterium]|nr:hypothetical protein [Chloroflexota bacterium]
MMPIILQTILGWMMAVRADLYVLTALIAVIWAVGEVITGYPEQPVRALRTGGALLLMVANATFACMALSLALTLVPGSESIWLAVGVGFSWQAMLRGGINVQPLPASSVSGASEGLGVPLNELYTRLQEFCVGQIQRHLVGERVALMERVINKLDISELARIARLVTTALSDVEAGPYIQRIESDQSRTQEQQEILLISLILANHGADILRERVKGQRKSQ